MKLKLIIWIASSKEDLLGFPKDIQSSMGYGLYLAQKGEKHLHCKVLKGFTGASVLEIRESNNSGTFRVVYVTKFSNIIFVLHAFQKKSKQGIKTPKQEIDLIKKRLKDAQEIYEELKNEKKF
ncbi:type II toxin-antitoxin system RelE/ParE family toxin [Candidatus Babeliales bacterium]|nr:type II toxin-antitoxin system RelE/ParE family toxin [Candidatus Babeliales bacterium]MCF7899788.1 type II toxin-antitoxin system RelE/ParE family toxin [Candidatus Babeliales bacterium]